MQINPDILAITNQAIIASAEQEVLPRFRQLESKDIDTKTSPEDFVTIADISMEMVLTDKLLNIIPGSVVVGEEAISTGKVSLKLLEGDDYCWIVDPIDGTRNFVNGIEFFTNLVSLSHKGEIVAGWIYDPVHKVMANGLRGHGSFYQGAPVKLASARSLKEMRGRVSYAKSQQTAALLKDFAGMEKQVAAFEHDTGSGHSFLAILAGQNHFYLSKGNKPWDVSAGAFLLNEAGGLSQLMNGDAYHPLGAIEQFMISSSDPAGWPVLTQFFSQAA